MEKQIRIFLENAGWCRNISSVKFLAAGEYNQNYLVRDAEKGKSVFRINHGSQLGLDNQIEYEFSVLKAVEASTVTPKAYHCDGGTGDFGGGVLLMKFLPGRPLDYKKDGKRAARIFSKIHTLPPSAALIIQDNPVLDIARESNFLLHKYKDHPLKKEYATLLEYHGRIRTLGQDHGPYFKNEATCIVNTEVNSHNFLISDSNAFLVDWEKAVVSYRYQDLGHFLVPTTTLWKSDEVYTDTEKRSFLKYYLKATHLDIPFEELFFKTRLLEKTILLRGLSWCFMAYYEYTETERALKNRETFNKIKQYLSEMDWLLTSLES